MIIFPVLFWSVFVRFLQVSFASLGDLGWTYVAALVFVSPRKLYEV